MQFKCKLFVQCIILLKYTLCINQIDQYTIIDANRVALLVRNASGILIINPFSPLTTPIQFIDLNANAMVVLNCSNNVKGLFYALSLNNASQSICLICNQKVVCGIIEANTTFTDDIQQFGVGFYLEDTLWFKAGSGQSVTSNDVCLVNGAQTQIHVFDINNSANYTNFMLGVQGIDIMSHDFDLPNIGQFAAVFKDHVSLFLTRGPTLKYVYYPPKKIQFIQGGSCGSSRVFFYDDLLSEYQFFSTSLNSLIKQIPNNISYKGKQLEFYLDIPNAMYPNNISYSKTALCVGPFPNNDMIFAVSVISTDLTTQIKEYRIALFYISSTTPDISTAPIYLGQGIPITSNNTNLGFRQFQENAAFPDEFFAVANYADFYVMNIMELNASLFFCLSDQNSQPTWGSPYNITLSESLTTCNDEVPSTAGPINQTAVVLSVATNTTNTSMVCDITCATCSVSNDPNKCLTCNTNSTYQYLLYASDAATAPTDTAQCVAICPSKFIYDPSVYNQVASRQPTFPTNNANATDMWDDSFGTTIVRWTAIQCVQGCPMNTLVYNINNELCTPCHLSCKKCSVPNDVNACLQCASVSDFIIYPSTSFTEGVTAGLCNNFCPVGNFQVNATELNLAGQTLSKCLGYCPAGSVQNQSNLVDLICSSLNNQINSTTQTTTYVDIKLQATQDPTKFYISTNDTLSPTQLNNLIQSINVTSIKDYDPSFYHFNITLTHDNKIQLQLTLDQSIAGHPVLTLSLDQQNLQTMGIDTANANIQIALSSFTIPTESQLQTIKTVSQVASKGSQVTAASSVLASQVAGTTAFSAIMMLGLIAFLQYTSTDFPPNVQAAFNNIQQFPPSFILGSNSGNLIEPQNKDIDNQPLKFQSLGISPYMFGNILENIIQTGIVILIGLSTAFIYSKCFDSRIKHANQSLPRRIFISILRFIVWNNVYILIIGMYVDGVLFSWIHLFYGRPLATTSINLYFPQLIIVIICVLLPFHIFFITKTCWLTKTYIEALTENTKIACVQMDTQIQNEQISLKKNQQRISIKQEQIQSKLQLSDTQQQVNDQNQQFQAQSQKENLKQRQSIHQQEQIKFIFGNNKNNNNTDNNVLQPYQKSDDAAIQLQQNQGKSILQTIQQNIIQKFYLQTKFIDKEQYLLKYKFLYEELKETHVFQRYFVTFDIIRIITITILIAALQQHMVALSFINASILLIFLILLIIYRPISNKYIQIINIFAELCVFLAYSASFYLSTQESKNYAKQAIQQVTQTDRDEANASYYYIGSVIVYGCLGVTYISMIMLVVPLVLAVKRIYAYLFKKKPNAQKVRQKLFRNVALEQSDYHQSENIHEGAEQQHVKNFEENVVTTNENLIENQQQNAQKEIKFSNEDFTEEHQFEEINEQKMSDNNNIIELENDRQVEHNQQEQEDEESLSFLSQGSSSLHNSVENGDEIQNKNDNLPQ